MSDLSPPPVSYISWSGLVSVTHKVVENADHGRDELCSFRAVAPGDQVIQGTPISCCQIG